jgi:7SK snRNA methylphosphate capping enzyme
MKYYDYRRDCSERLQVLKRSWFHDKFCLDVGCCSGELTLAIAKAYLPRKVEGIDIDEAAIFEAQQKLEAITPQEVVSVTHFLPRSLIKSALTSTSRPLFPQNCSFSTNDILTFPEREKYEVLTCFNVVKWVHLTNGDAGLLSMFEKIWNLLAPLGLFIFEYQPWSSYVKNRNSTSLTKEIFPTICIRPEEFLSLLTQTTREVNERKRDKSFHFTLVHSLGTPLEQAKGFKRPLLVLKKAELPPTVFIPQEIANPSHVLTKREKRSILKKEERMVNVVSPPLAEEWGGIVDRASSVLPHDNPIEIQGSMEGEGRGGAGAGGLEAAAERKSRKEKRRRERESKNDVEKDVRSGDGEVHSIGQEVEEEDRRDRKRKRKKEGEYQTPIVSQVVPDRIMGQSAIKKTKKKKKVKEREGGGKGEEYEGESVQIIGDNRDGLSFVGRVGEGNHEGVAAVPVVVDVLATHDEERVEEQGEKRARKKESKKRKKKQDESVSTHSSS